MAKHYLSKLFEPLAIAVIGASPRHPSIGCKVFSNLINSGYQGSLYAVNPKYQEIQQRVCVSSIDDIAENIDLAIITAPARTIPKLITECGNKGIHHILILSSGFSEIGEEGRVLERHIVNIAKGYHIYLVGPHCLGIMRPSFKLNATFDNNFKEPGNVALVSQSSAFTAGILDSSFDKKIGFSAVVSLGNSADIDFADILDYLAFDTTTKCILLHMENIQHARKFMSALSEAARKKPVIILKAGRTGDDQIFDVALRQAGALRVMTIEEWFLAAEILTRQYPAQGKRLLIITNSGSTGVLAKDRAQDLRVELPTLSDKTLVSLREILPKHSSLLNPINILEDAAKDRYAEVLKIVAEDENIDGILVLLAPYPLVQPFEVAQMLVQMLDTLTKPILTCWLGEKHMTASLNLFALHGIPYFETPEKAVQAFYYLAEHFQIQQGWSKLPEFLSQKQKPNLVFVRQAIEKALSQNRFLLTKEESKEIINTFSIPYYAHMAIHPYPEHLVAFYKLKDGSSIKIRPVQPEDTLIVKEFVSNLSREAKYQRFMQHIRELTADKLVRLTHIDYAKEMTFVATYQDAEVCIGVAHYTMNPDRVTSEFAIAVADSWQKRGIGSILMRALCEDAKKQGLSAIIGSVLATNRAMLNLTRHLGFHVIQSEDPTITMIRKNL